MRGGFVDECWDVRPVRVTCRVLGIPLSGHHARRSRPESTGAEPTGRFSTTSAWSTPRAAGPTARRGCAPSARTSGATGRHDRCGARARGARRPAPAGAHRRWPARATPSRTGRTGAASRRHDVIRACLGVDPGTGREATSAFAGAGPACAPGGAGSRGRGPRSPLAAVLNRHTRKTVGHARGPVAARGRRPAPGLTCRTERGTRQAHEPHRKALAAVRDQVLHEPRGPARRRSEGGPERLDDAPLPVPPGVRRVAHRVHATYADARRVPFGRIAGPATPTASARPRAAAHRPP